MSLLEKWCWFIKRYDETQSDPIVQELIATETIFREAKRIMDMLSTDQSLRDAIFEHDRRSMDMAQLLEERETEGLQEGSESTLRSVIQRMLADHCSVDLIMKYCNTSADLINQLKNEMISR